MDGWILRDNTGLKGLAADFARSQLEDDRLSTSPAGQVLSKVDCAGGEARELEMYHQHLPSCSHIVHAVGFTRDPLPQLAKNGRALALEFDHESGKFHERGDGPVIPGLFGAGIAFPERVVDPYGNVEYAVGFFKFMKFLKRVTPFWGAAWFSPSWVSVLILHVRAGPWFRILGCHDSIPGVMGVSFLVSHCLLRLYSNWEQSINSQEP